MIGYLSGTIKFKEEKSLIIDVKGVGYELHTPIFVLQECKEGEKKHFSIYMHVKENELTLFGFLNTEDKKIFLHLISVSGIGPKTGMTILSYANGAKNIIRGIQKADVNFFESIKGIGKKAAQRIIVDLKGKIGGLKDLEFETEADRDLIEALSGLGFSKEEIRKSIKGIDKDLDLEEKIRLALREK